MPGLGLSNWFIHNIRDVQWCAFVIAVGGRVGPGNTVYPVDPVALKHRAGVERETAVPAEAYAPFPEAEPIPFREEFLPGW